MRDVYLYEGTNVLKNLLNIKESNRLEEAEADYTINRLKELAEKFGLEEDEMEDLLETYGYQASDFFPWKTVEEAEKVDEKPTTEESETNLPEEKSFEVMRKEFSDELEQKNVEIKAFAKRVDDLEWKLSETVKVLSSVVNAVKSMHNTVEKTVVQNSYQFSWPIVKDEANDEIEKAVKLIKSW